MAPPTGWVDPVTKRDLEHVTASSGLWIGARLARFERRIIRWNLATVLIGLTACTAIARVI